jgi:hypothetical protein
LLQRGSLGHGVPRKLSGELEVLVAAGDVLGDGEVVHFQAQALHAGGVWSVNGNQAFLPTLGQGRGVGADALRVVAEAFVEEGALADRAIDQVGQLGLVLRVNVGLHRGEQRKRRARKLSEHRLAADDHDLAVRCDGSSCANHVLKLGTRRTPSSSRRDRARRRTATTA